MDNIKFADWTLPEIAFANNELNKKYFVTGEYRNKPEYYKLKEAFNYILQEEPNRPLNVLDIGSGSGWHALYFEKEGFGKEIIYNGIDISPSMCENAKCNCPSGNFFVKNIEDDPIGNYDIVFESAVLELVKDWRKGLINSLRSSKKWFISHRLFFTEDKTITEQTKTYLEIPDVRYHIGLNDLKEILDNEGFLIEREDVWVKGSYQMGTFIMRKK